MKKNYGFIASIVIVFVVLVFISWLTMRVQSTKTNDPVLKTVSVVEFRTEYDNLKTDNAVIIDVRTQGEFNDGHIINAINIDFDNIDSFNAEINKLDKNIKYLIYCRSGNRSTQALAIMQDKGFQNVLNLKGGINSWTEAGMGNLIENNLCLDSSCVNK
jgi:rhodanese-related sulfurtransferase